VYTDIKNLSDRGPEQSKKTAEGAGNMTIGQEMFEVSIDSFLLFRPLEKIGDARGLQDLLASEFK
jgi:hypothetical protein